MVTNPPIIPPHAGGWLNPPRPGGEGLREGFLFFNEISEEPQALGYRFRPDFVAAAGSNVATPQLVYALFPELVAGAVELQVKRSIDGGRNWEPPVTVYTVNTAGGEDLNTGDKGTFILAWGNAVYVTFLTNAHNLAQRGQTLWVVASEDQGLSWSPPLNVSTGWNRLVAVRPGKELSSNESRRNP